jgi:hypothetical protein
MKQHSTDWTSLIFGAAFLTIASLALAQQSLDLQINGVWLVPFLAAVIGIGILSGGRGKKALTDTPSEETVEVDIID